MINATDKVFPSSDPDAKKADPTRYVPGIDLRTYIAVEIAAGICSSPPMMKFDDSEAWFWMDATKIAEHSVSIANALIAELKK